MIVVAVRGKRRYFGFLDVVEHHLVERVRGLEIEQQPAAVGRPADFVPQRSRVEGAFRFAHQFVQLCRGIEEPQLIVLVLVRDPFPVRRGNRLPAQDLAVLRELLRGADSVCGRLPQLHFAALGGKEQKRLTILHVSGIAKAPRLQAEDLDKSPLLHRSDKHPATGDQRHVSAIRRNVSRRQVDRKSTRLNSSHQIISYAVFCLKKKKKKKTTSTTYD